MSENQVIRNLKPVFEESLEPVKKSRLVNALSDINSNLGSPFRLTPKPTAHIASRETQHKDKIPKTVRYRHIRYITCYNLAFEYVNKYNICQILDRGVYPVNWTSYRLRTETIYFDTATHRYELKRYSFNDPRYRKKSCFCLSAVKEKYIMTRPLMKQGKIPLPEDQVTLCEDHLSWTEIIWGTTQLTIRTKKYEPRYLTFYRNC